MIWWGLYRKWQFPAINIGCWVVSAHFGPLSVLYFRAGAPQWEPIEEEQARSKRLKQGRGRVTNRIAR